ncbi:MAG: hypothetical protein ACRETS_03055 [Steroidobacteraceae bacterium]
MSTPNPIPLVQTGDPIQAFASAVIAYLTAKDILSENGVPAQLAKAKSIAAITGALIELNTGGATGLADLQTALANLVSSVKDPAGAMLINELLATLSTQIAVLEQTILGKLAGALNNVVVAQIHAVATYYVTSLSAVPVAHA